MPRVKRWKPAAKRVAEGIPIISEPGKMFAFRTWAQKYPTPPLNYCCFRSFFEHSFGWSADCSGGGGCQPEARVHHQSSSPNTWGLPSGVLENHQGASHGPERLFYFTPRKGLGAQIWVSSSTTAHAFILEPLLLWSQPIMSSGYSALQKRMSFIMLTKH